MATLQKAIKVGSSVAAVLPKALLKGAGITPGSSILVEAADGGILVRSAESARRPHARDDALVADTALGLIRRYQGALKRLADA